MKYLPIVLSLALGWVPGVQPSNAAAKGRNNLAVSAATKARLQLTTTVVKERSCSADYLSLDLRLSFRNIGDQVVIIDRRSFVTRSRVSRSLKEALAGTYEAETRADLFDDSFPANPTDMTNFAVVRPGEVYDLQTDQTRVSFLLGDGTPHFKDYLSAGSHFLQIDVAMWTYMVDAAQFRQKWRASGLLWSKGLTSQPMPFTIEQNRPISKCS